jgi:nucleotide-binding universal stress UspA family protein
MNTDAFLTSRSSARLEARAALGEHLLVAVDFSDASRPAIAQAGLLAASVGARITLVHVVEGGQAEHEARGRLEALRSAVSHDPSDVEVVILHAPVAARAIADVATAIAADAIVVGTRKRGLRLGSVADYLVRHARCSVLVARGEVDAIDRVCVGTDFTADAERGVVVAAAIASCLGAELSLVHVHPTLWPRVGRTHEATDDAAAADHLAALERRALGGVAHASIHVLDDPSPGHALAAYAREHRCDLVVVAAHGGGAIERLLIGSVTEKVVHRASCSVLVVNGKRMPAKPRR